MRLADRMSQLGTESAFDVLAQATVLEAAGRRVIHLEIGEPDFATPAHVVAAAEEAMAKGLTHYVAAPGIWPLREAVAASLARSGRLATSPDRVVITPGGKPVMFFTILALCQAGDEVVCPDPGLAQRKDGEEHHRLAARSDHDAVRRRRQPARLGQRSRHRLPQRPDPRRGDVVRQSVC